MTSTGPEQVVPSPSLRGIALVVLGLSVTAGAGAITILSLIMRSVTEIGGSCADGGPDVSAQPCPSGTGTALLLVFAGAFAFVIGTLWAASVLRAPVPLWLGWPAVFLTLGWNLLEDGLDPPMGGGVVVGFVFCGVLFLVMGATPLVFRAFLARSVRRTRRAQGAPATSPPTAVPAPRRLPAPAAGRRAGERSRRAESATFDEEVGR